MDNSIMRYDHATPETRGFLDYEEPVESSSRKRLKRFGIPVAALGGLGLGLVVSGVAKDVQAKTLVAVGHEDIFDVTPGTVQNIDQDGGVSEFVVDGVLPGEVCYGPDGDFLVVDGVGKSLLLVDKNTGVVKKTILSEYNYALKGVLYDNASDTIYCFENGKAAQNWEGISHAFTPDGNGGYVDNPLNLGVGISAKDACFVNGSVCYLCKDGLRMFSFGQNGYEVSSFNNFDTTFLSGIDYSFSLNLLVVTRSNFVHFYNADALQEVSAMTINVPGGGATNSRVNPLNPMEIWVAASLSDGIRVYDIETGVLKQTYPLSGEGSAYGKFSPDGLEYSLAVSDLLAGNRTEVYRIDSVTGEITNLDNPDVAFYADGDEGGDLDVANSDPLPPQDTDNDGITDDIDGCPQDYNPAQVDKDQNGTQDACQETPLQGYSNIYEFAEGTHVHTQGNVSVNTDANAIMIDQNSKVNVIHSGNESLGIEINPYMMFDVEVFEGSVTVPTFQGDVVVNAGEKKSFNGESDSVLLALSGTDFTVETFDYIPPVVEPNPEPIDYVEPMPDVVEQPYDTYEPDVYEEVIDPYDEFSPDTEMPDTIEIKTDTGLDIKIDVAEIMADAAKQDQTVNPDTPSVDEWNGNDQLPSVDEWNGNEELSTVDEWANPDVGSDGGGGSKGCNTASSSPQGVAGIILAKIAALLGIASLRRRKTPKPNSNY
jgi:hypothetical protein